MQELNLTPDQVVADSTDGITIVNRHLQFPKARLVQPNASGYLHVAAEIDRIWPFGLGPVSSRKRDALARTLALAERLETLEPVLRAPVFVARFSVPGLDKRMASRPHVHVARFDLVVLIETIDPSEAAELQRHAFYAELVSMLEANSDYVHVVRARNTRKMGEVDASRDGVFLFNYFHGDDPTKLIPVWYYSAGWFQTRTELHNSILLEPDEGQKSQYGIINHCRWDHWHDVLPDLRFRPTFRSYVLANFDANGVVPMPILYRLASRSHSVL
jgi:hypothetical protein